MEQRHSQRHIQPREIVLVHLAAFGITVLGIGAITLLLATLGRLFL